MPSSIRILMIDDDEEDYILVQDIVEEVNNHKFTLDWVSSYESGLKKIKEKKHDVYLIDYRMGSKTGIDLIREAIESGCEEPLILLTGQSDHEIDNSALEAGASDFLLKGIINSQSLERSIRYSIAHTKNIKEIKYLNAKLEDRVKERTQVLEKAIMELENTKMELREALAKEKDLNELKSRFVAMASHEFRTPLATILSSLSLIDKYGERNELEKQEKHIERCKTSVNNLTDIINDVLSLSNLEEGGVKVMNSDFDIKELISEINTEMQSIAKENQQILYKHSGEKIVSLDKKILKNILLNLLSNAIKFSPDGKPINVTTRSNELQFIISIKDHGMGITDEEQKHLFERFFRAKNASAIQGTGLGLSIVSKYVELMNGDIQCKSRLDEGTEFIITFPKNTVLDNSGT